MTRISKRLMMRFQRDVFLLVRTRGECMNLDYRFKALNLVSVIGIQLCSSTHSHNLEIEKFPEKKHNGHWTHPELHRTPLSFGIAERA